MNNNYYEHEYIRDEGGNVSGIVFIHRVNKDNTTPLSDTFEINVNKYYSLYDRRMRKDGGLIKVLRIDESGRKIYYKRVYDYTDTGQLNDDFSHYVANAKIHLGTEELFMPVTDISGTTNRPPLFSVNTLNPMEGFVIREGGRNKKRHFRKSKKSRRTKRSRSVRRSRNRKGGMLSDDEISEKKDRIKILALTEDKKDIDRVNYRTNYNIIYGIWYSLGSEENKKQFEEKFIEAAKTFFKDHSYRVPLYKRIITDLKATDSYNNQHPEDLHMHKSPPSLAVNYRAGGNSSRRRHHRRSSKKYKKARKSHRRVRS